MTDATSDKNPTLNYGRRPRWRRRLVIASAVLVCVSGYVGVRWYTPHFRQYQVQRQLNAMVPPAGTILYSEEPADLARLIASPSYTTRPSEEFIWMDGGGFDRVPTVWRPGLTKSGSIPPMSQIDFSMDKTPVGRRRAAGGVGRMIFVQAYTFFVRDGPYTGSLDLALPVWEVSSIATLWPGPPVTRINKGRAWVRLDPSDRLVLYAPTLDPADESHLSFEYALNGQRGTIDGWLLPNDTMAFRLTSGPATLCSRHGYVTAKP